MAKIKFIGVGSAFAGPELGNSNMVIESDDGKLLLIDCGFRAQDMLQEAYGIGNADVGRIDGVYISHLHADHIGGLEWLALCTYFNPSCKKPRLYCIANLMEELWDQSLQGGLRTLQMREDPDFDVEADLGTYFRRCKLKINEPFTWEGIKFHAVETTHVVSGYRHQLCYGLMIQKGDGQKIFLSGDTQFAPNQLHDYYGVADVILHDCETTPFMSRVHAHYDELNTLSVPVKERMWLYHYNAVPEVLEGHGKAQEDGFAGFIEVGQEFEI